jgi:hypothetical protein
MLDAGPNLEQELISFCREHLSPIECLRSMTFCQNGQRGDAPES